MKLQAVYDEAWAKTGRYEGSPVEVDLQRLCVARSLGSRDALPRRGHPDRWSRPCSPCSVLALARLGGAMISNLGGVGEWIVEHVLPNVLRIGSVDSDRQQFGWAISWSACWWP